MQYRLWLSRLGLALTSLVAAGISASLGITSLGERTEQGGLQDSSGATAHSNEVLLLALAVTATNIGLVWFWLPKAWVQPGRSRSLRLIVSLLAAAVTTALVAGFLFRI